MKTTLFALGSMGMLLLLALVVPVAADDAGTISGISPTTAYRGNTVSITITGSDFNTSLLKYVRLYYDSDTSNITDSSITSKSSTSIVAKFTIGSSKTTGDWYVVVVNSDGSETEYTGDPFVICNEMTLSSITPTYAKTNTDDVSFTLTGSGLTDVDNVHLYKSGYDNVTAGDVSVSSSTTVTGTFDLTDIDEVTYKVCADDAYGNDKCSSSVTFEVTTDEVGEIDVSSSPTGASVYIDSTYLGTTPYVASGLSAGSHVVKVTKDGYQDWSTISKVTSGGTNTVSANLEAAATAVITTPSQMQMMPTTQRTAIPVTTIKVPTTYPKITTAVPTTKASPVDGAVVLGAIGLGFAVLYRKN